MKSINENYRFKRAYFRGKNIKGKSIVLYFFPNRKGENFFGITVSKKVGKAVVRNKVRRRIKESIIPLEKKLLSGYDIVFVARGISPYKTFSELSLEIEELLIKASLIGKLEEESD